MKTVPNSQWNVAASNQFSKLGRLMEMTHIYDQI